MWTKIASLVLLWTCVAAVKYKCPDHIPRDSATGVYGRACFRAELNTEKDYEDASSYCWNNGGYLAMVKSRGTNDFLTGMIRDNLGFYGPLWIGLNDIEDENTFRWVDGTLVDYSNWDDEDEGPRGGLVTHYVEDCVALHTETGGTWHDHNCNSVFLFHNAKKRFICQYRTKIVTTPAPPSTTTTTTTRAPPTTPTTRTTTTTSPLTTPKPTTPTTTQTTTTTTPPPPTTTTTPPPPTTTMPTTTIKTTAPPTTPPSPPTTTTTTPPPPPTTTASTTTSPPPPLPTTTQQPTTKTTTTTTTATTTPPTSSKQPSNATTEAPLSQPSL